MSVYVLLESIIKLVFAVSHSSSPFAILNSLLPSLFAFPCLFFKNWSPPPPLSRFSKILFTPIQKDGGRKLCNYFSLLTFQGFKPSLPLFLTF